MSMVKEREYRDIPVKVITDDATVVGVFDENGIRVDIPLDENSAYRVEGYATTWERYLLWEDEFGKVYEQFSAAAFQNTDMSDVIMQYDHQGAVFARISNNTLELTVDDHGLKVKADLGKTTKAQSLYEDIKTEMVTKMSWGFRTGEYHIVEEGKDITIVHDSVKKIFDVSAVSIPANDTTNINARSFDDGAIEKMRQELTEREMKRRALALKVRLAQM